MIIDITDKFVACKGNVKITGLIVLLTSCVFVACKDGTNVPYYLESISDCHNEEQWDSTTVANHLLGTWQWAYQLSGMDGGVHVEGIVNDTIDKGLEVVFHGNGSLEVMNADGTKTVHSWKISYPDNIFFLLSVDPSVPSLSQSRILFCNEYVAFHASYLDWVDDYFIKIDTGPQ